MPRLSRGETAKYWRERSAAARILIVDDVAVNRVVLEDMLGAACYATDQAADGQTALRPARRTLLDAKADGCNRVRADRTAPAA